MRWKWTEVGLYFCLLLSSSCNEGSLLFSRIGGAGLASEPGSHNFFIPKPAGGCPTLPESVHREVDYTFSRNEKEHELEAFIEENHNALQVLDGDYGEITRVGFCVYDHVELNPLFDQMGGLYIFRAHTSDRICPEGFQSFKWKDERIQGDLISDNVGMIYNQIEDDWFIEACKLTPSTNDQTTTTRNVSLPLPLIILQNGVGKCRAISQTTDNGTKHIYDSVEFRIGESVFCYYSDRDIQVQLHWDHSPTMELPLNKGVLALRVRHIWGGICSDGFNETVAGVACFHLGFSRNGAQVFEIHRQRTPVIHILDFFCTGAELSLNECEIKMNNADLDVCRQNSSVGVACEAKQDAPSPFGMRDGSLQEFQISLSAQAELKSDGRVCHDTAECSKVTVKFDTISVSSLTGVDIHVHHLEDRCGNGGNVQLYTGGSSDEPSLTPTTSFIFRAQDERIFRAINPLKNTSFVQVTFTGIECLSIELVGYRRFTFDNLDLDCGSDSRDLGWLNTTDIHVPLIELMKDEPDPTDRPTVNSTENCKSSCQRTEGASACIAITFDENCRLYRKNDTWPSTFLKRTASAQRLCLAGTDQSQDRVASNKTILSPGPIQSMGYPFGYDTNVVYTFYILFPEDQYIDIVFEVISLRQPVGEIHNYCEDVIQMEGITLNSRQNNVQQRYIFPSNTLTMELISCPRNLRSEAQDKGFRAYVFQTEIRLCTLLCKINRGFLIPSSYFGRTLANQLVTWKFEHDGDLYMDFLEFDIACDVNSRGSWLTINGINYCNLNKPPKQFNILQGYCEVSFFNIYSPPYSLFGFVAKFEIRDAFSHVKTWISTTDRVLEYLPEPTRIYRSLSPSEATEYGCRKRRAVIYSPDPSQDYTETERPERRPVRRSVFGNTGAWLLLDESWEEEIECISSYGVTKVASCSEKLGQCFDIYTLEDVHRLHVYTPMCPFNNDGFVVTMKNREEMEFVAYHMWKQWKVSSIPIGLVTRMGTNNTLTNRWFDGSPLLFRPSSFIQGDLLNRIYEMKIDKFHRISWVPRRLSYMWGNRFVCKRPMRKTSITKIEKPVSTIQLNMQSNYHRCWNDEIILLSYLCDGQRDCFDGSDEMNCTKTACSLDNHFQCADGTCIPINMYCDGRVECPDSSDEYCDKAFSLSLSESSKVKRRVTRMIKPNFEYSEQTGYTATGILQIQYKDKIYRICSDGLHREDLPIVCKELGYSRWNGSLQNVVQRPESLLSVEFNCSGVTSGIRSCIRVSSASQCASNRGMKITCTSEKESPVLEVKSCADVWRTGKRKSGFYRVGKDGHFIECRFEDVWSNSKIWAYLHDFDIRRNVDLITGLQTDYDGEVLAYYKRLQCNQSIIQTCKQPTDIIPGACLCIEVQLMHGRGRHDQNILPCSNTTSFIYNELDNADEWLRQKLIFSIKRGRDFFFTLNVYESEMTANTVLRLGPLVCEEDFTPENTMLPCDSGPQVPISTRCLYNVDRRKIIVGCSDMSHLQDCGNFLCPKDYIKCPNSYCIQIRFLCDGTPNCPNSEDEEICGDGRTCPNQYRCRNAPFCLPTSQLCDGTPHCPEGDDERFCDMYCPEGCECEGYAVRCIMDKITAEGIHRNMPQSLRSLDLSFNRRIVALRTPLEMPFAVYINFSFCEINHIEPNVFGSLPYLKILDLSHNKLKRLYPNTFRGLTRCSMLLMEGNPSIGQIEPLTFSGLDNLKELAVKNTNIGTVRLDMFMGLFRLKKLDISSNQIHTIEEGGFRGLTALEELIMSQNRILHFTDNIFGGLENLHMLHSDEYRICCFKPETVTDENCYPHRNEFSSCTDLMRKDELRFFMWIIGISALMGNLLSLIYRFTTDRRRLKIGYGVFVTNLSIADFFMGVYLLIIAGADAHYRGRYIENDKIWRFSNLCTAAGIISTISSEASVFFICLITVDRLLVIKYPFGNVRFTPQSAVLFSILTWVFAAFIATLPVVYIDYFKNGFYARSCVCLALPLTRDRPNGWEYSLIVFVFFNFLTFLLIAFGQLMIYREMKSSMAQSSVSTKRKNDLTVAKNLLMVVSTDFLCWCPIGVMGIMSLLGEPISGDVYAWAAVLILPINSALNPFLYTFSAIIRKKTCHRIQSTRTLQGDFILPGTSRHKDQATMPIALAGSGCFSSGRDNKFVPSLTEQDRLTEREVTLMKKNLQIARNKWIQPLKLPRSLPLTEYLNDHTLKPKEILLLTRRVVKVLDFLHSRHVYHGKLDISAVTTIVRDGVIRDAVIKVDPQMIERRRNDKVDIENLGRLINKLLEFRA